MHTRRSPSCGLPVARIGSRKPAYHSIASASTDSVPFAAMGRKTAPQALPLGSTDAPGEDPPAGETHPQSSSPIPSSSPTSPRSPRSPFGFAQKKTQLQGPGERKPLHVADLLQQPQHPLDASQYLHISSALHQPQSPPLERSSGQLPQGQQQYHRPQEHAEEQQQGQRPYRQELGQPPSFTNQQVAHRHHRNNEEKASKSGFFFNFSKSSKSSDRLNTDQHSDSRSDITSRGTDSSTSRQNTRQTGKSLRL